MVYGFFGCTGDECKTSHSLAAIFVLFLIGLMLQTYILLKILFTGQYLENLVGQSYIEKYLGKYTGSQALITLLKYCGPAITLTGAELITANIEAETQFKAAREVKRVFNGTNKLAGLEPSLEETKQNDELQLNYIQRASNATGIVTRGFAAAAIKVGIGSN